MAVKKVQVVHGNREVIAYAEEAHVGIRNNIVVEQFNIISNRNHRKRALGKI